MRLIWIWIADCRVRGISNCPHNGSLCSLNSAQVSRDGIYHCEGGATDVLDRGLLVVQEPTALEAQKFDIGVINAVCDVALLDR